MNTDNARSPPVHELDFEFIDRPRVDRPDSLLQRDIVYDRV